jgi:hypothetical protein
VAAYTLESHAPPPSAASSIPKVALVLLVALKVGVLLAFGPASQPDSTSYVSYADQILSGEFLHVDLAHDPMPVTLTRVIGYPAIIAACKAVAGNHWAWAVVLLQFAVSLWATAMVYRLARAFGLGIWLSLGVATAQATGMQFVVDQALLSDSFAGSTMTIVTCILALIALRRKPASMFSYLGVGALLATAFLIRDVFAFMAVGLVPLVISAVLAESSHIRRLAACILVFAPVIAAHIAYTEWNRQRVGAPVVTSVAQAAVLDALTEAAVYDPTVYSGSSPIDVVGRRILPKMKAQRLGFEQETSAFLHDEYGWDAVRMSHEATAAYLRGWRDHPRAMIHHVLFHISETQLHQAVRPIETVRDVLLWNTGSDQGFARERSVRDGNWWAIPGVIVNWIVMTISVFVFLAFLLITPIRLVREGWTAETGVSIGLWCFYLVVGGLYAAVHLEPRYLTPVVAGSIVVGTVNIVRVIEHFRQRTATNPRQAVSESV